MIDANVDHIDVTNARIRVNKSATTEIGLEEAEMKRKFYMGVMYRTNVEAAISEWRRGAKHYALHGMTVFKTVWNADLWPDKPIQKDQSDETYAKTIEKWEGKTEKIFPVSISAIHPANIRQDPHHIKPEYFIETHEKACFGVMNHFKKWSNPMDRQPEDKVDWVEWWDGEWRCLLIDNEPIFKVKGGLVKHKYGFLPYVPIESGLGNLSIDGDFLMRYVGGIRYMKDILIAESRAYSIAEYILKSGAWPYTTITGGEEARALEELPFKYGEFKYLGPDTKIEKHSPDVPPDALRTWLGITADYISSHAAPPSSRGMGESGVRSGADRRLIMSEASLRFAHSIPAFRHGTARVLTNCIKLFKNVIPGNVRMWSQVPGDEWDVVIKKDKLEEPFNCEVEFAPINEEYEYRKEDNLRMNLQTGLETRRSARRKLSNVDPIAMEEEELRSQIRDAITPTFVQKAVDAAGMAVAQQEAANQMRSGKQPQQQQMGGMTTGIPQARPTQGSPQQIAQQRQGQTSPLNPGQGMGGGGSRH